MWTDEEFLLSVETSCPINSSKRKRQDAFESQLEKGQDLTEVASNDPHYQFITRITKYQLVNSLFAVSKAYYQKYAEILENRRKENLLMKKSYEKLEAKLEQALHVAELLLRISPFKKVSKTVLSSLDHFWCNQLDKLERSLKMVMPQTQEPTADQTNVSSSFHPHLSSSLFSKASGFLSWLSFGIGWMGHRRSSKQSSTESCTSPRELKKRKGDVEVRPRVIETDCAVVGRDPSSNHKIINQYLVLNPIGMGSYGKVKLALNSTDNCLYAIKVCSKTRRRRMGGRRGFALENVMKEVQILKSLQHPNVIKLHEVINDPLNDNIFLVFEYAEGGSLMKDLDHAPLLPMSQIKKYFVDVVAGLEYLHKQNIIHRDIKPDNILITGDGVAKISDFGVSQKVESLNDASLRSSMGSPAFLSPELCNPESQGLSGPPIDIWALGITLYALVFGRMPFMASIELELYDAIMHQELYFPFVVDPNLQDLLRNLLDKDPKARISIEGIKNHPWCKM